ncbi:MAG: YdcF family protein [Actinomycetota bacterium]|nr:YdcF family protein [Actinomycetota bacterium]
MIALVVIGEVADWAGRRGPRLPHDNAATAAAAVVVLSFGGDNPFARNVQRWRVSMALAAAARHRSSTVVFTGGAGKGRTTEASQMAKEARRQGLAAASIVLEERASSTWENVHLSAPLVSAAQPIVVVSDGLHARRARNYWAEQFPFDTVIVDDRYRFGDHFWLKTPAAMAKLLRLGRAAARNANAFAWLRATA